MCTSVVSFIPQGNEKINNQFLSESMLIWATSRENLSLGLCDQIRLKPAYSATKTSRSLEILDSASICIILSMQRTIRLRGWDGLSTPLLFAYIVNNYPMTKDKPIYHARFHRALSSVYALSVINQFIQFSHGVVIYIIMQSLRQKEAKTYIVFLLSDRVGSAPSCLFGQEPQRFLRKQILMKYPFCRYIFIVKLN